MLFDTVLEVFEKTKPEGFTRKPSEKFSSERMGGWILKDAEDLHVGFIGKTGRVSYLELHTTTPTTDHRRGK
jgi:hypothetical protein